ncbi:uncharacterized protein E0L32_009962 [Thyridium curvatum]|uniref:Uncharacterized protein n=1 Tax=Thyridium curvatum TaxID=1093900 RepID=A0A507ALY5_9PEZI|nr:uncharacterized protein E0L32_009962 [Thyridium curvatum]TPX08623.1 hypothetical protein E0L32_009962 [Thyridium curvatum]
MAFPSQAAILESVLGKRSREEATNYQRFPHRRRFSHSREYMRESWPNKSRYDTVAKRLASFKESSAFYLAHYGSARVFILAACGLAYFGSNDEVGCPCCLRKVTFAQTAELLESKDWDATKFHESQCSLFKQIKRSCRMCQVDGYSRDQWTKHLWRAHLLPSLPPTWDQPETANEAAPNVKPMTLVQPKTVVSVEPSLKIIIKVPKSTKPMTLTQSSTVISLQPSPEISDKLISPSTLVRPTTVVSVEPTSRLSSKVTVVVSYHPTRKAISIASVDEIDSAGIIRQMTAAQIMELVSTMIPSRRSMAHLTEQESTSSPIENNITALMDRSEYDVLRANVRVMRQVLGLVHSESEASAGRSE